MSRTKKRKKYRINFKRFIPFIILLVLIVGLAVFGISSLIKKASSGQSGDNSAGSVSSDVNSGETVQNNQSSDKNSGSKTQSADLVSISLKCIGDVMAHDAQLEAALQSDGSYNFAESFKYVKKYLEDADLTLANMETTFPGQAPYKGYPTFRTPDSLIDAVVDCGVDVALYANNHILDNGTGTLLKSVNTMESKGLVVSGTRGSEKEKRYDIVEVNGVKVCILAYTYETPRSEGSRTLQSAVMSAIALDTVNSFTQDSKPLFEEDLKAIKAQMEDARSQGAEVFVFYMHWGEEYQLNASEWQKYMAEKLAYIGADVIFASHVHVPQEIEVLDITMENGQQKTVPVFYSMGNFISNQRTETLSSMGVDVASKTEEGMIACVDLVVNKRNGNVEVTRTSFIPTWVEKYEKNGKDCYYVIPLVDGYESNSELAASGHGSRAANALNHLTDLIGAKYLNRTKK